MIIWKDSDRRPRPGPKCRAERGPEFRAERSPECQSERNFPRAAGFLRLSRRCLATRGGCGGCQRNRVAWTLAEPALHHSKLRTYNCLGGAHAPQATSISRWAHLEATHSIRAS